MSYTDGKVLRKGKNGHKRWHNDSPPKSTRKTSSRVPPPVLPRSKAPSKFGTWARRVFLGVGKVPAPQPVETSSKAPTRPRDLPKPSPRVPADRSERERVASAPVLSYDVLGQAHVAGPHPPRLDAYTAAMLRGGVAKQAWSRVQRDVAEMGRILERGASLQEQIDALEKQYVDAGEIQGDLAVTGPLVMRKGRLEREQRVMRDRVQAWLISQGYDDEQGLRGAYGVLREIDAAPPTWQPPRQAPSRSSQPRSKRK